jgi:hypothetical protein
LVRHNPIDRAQHERRFAAKDGHNPFRLQPVGRLSTDKKALVERSKSAIRRKAGAISVDDNSDNAWLLRACGASRRTCDFEWT